MSARRPLRAIRGRGSRPGRGEGLTEQSRPVRCLLSRAGQEGGWPSGRRSSPEPLSWGIVRVERHVRGNKEGPTGCLDLLFKQRGRPERGSGSAEMWYGKRFAGRGLKKDKSQGPSDLTRNGARARMYQRNTAAGIMRQIRARLAVEKPKRSLARLPLHNHGQEKEKEN